MALMQMGFELEDCQQAIEYGKLSASEVVEWILAGKPQVTQPQPLLKLNPAVDSAASTSKPNHSTNGPKSPSGLSSGALGLERNPWASEDEPIVSWLSQSDEQRLAKLRFEEKQRQEARKEAQAEKMAKKKAHEDILKRIREDRENLKSRADPTDGASIAGPSTSAQLPKQQRDDSSCLLMIRLLDGSSVQKSFPAETPLLIVRDFVSDQCSVASSEIQLIQLFPHVEFEGADLSRSLRDLGFVPSGSLAVKKADSIASAQLNVETDKRHADPTDVTEPLKKKKPAPSFDQPPAPPLDAQPVVEHSWGGGQRLGDEDDVSGEEEQPMDDDDVVAEDDNILSPPPPAQIPAHQPAVPPGALFPNFQVVPMNFGGDDFDPHNWGAGNVLVGDVLQNVSVPHHSKTPKDLAGKEDVLESTSSPSAAGEASDWDKWLSHLSSSMSTLHLEDRIDARLRTSKKLHLNTTPMWMQVDGCLSPGSFSIASEAAARTYHPQNFFVVVDTNVMIHGDLKEIKENLVKRFNERLQLHFPFVVLQEIGRLEKAEGKYDPEVIEKASMSNTLLRHWKENNDKSLCFQTSSEVTKMHSRSFGFDIKSNDDQVVESAIQVKKRYQMADVAVLSSDCNLLNKTADVGLLPIDCATLSVRFNESKTGNEFIVWTSGKNNKLKKSYHEKRAARAAARRSSFPPPASAKPVDVAPLAPACAMPMLRDLLLHYIASQLNCPQSPIFGLHGIPENLASQILDFLVKDSRLKPGHLQNFISWKVEKIDLDYTPFDNQMLNELRPHVYLREVSLRFCKNISAKGLKNLKVLTFLEKLSLAGCHQLGDECVSVIKALPSLVYLSLEETAVSESGIKEYMTSAPQHLRGLDLSRTKVTEVIFVHLANAPSLVTLNMEQTQIAGLSGIQRLVKLVELNISNTRIITDALLCLLNLQTLAVLKCSNTPNINGDVAVSYLANLPLHVFQLPNRLTTTDEAIPHLTGMKLKELDLRNFVQITDASMPYIGQLTQLTVLRMSDTKITDNGLAHLQGLTNLEVLNLDRTAIGNAGTIVIRGFRELRELSLSSTGVTNGFLRSGVLSSCLELTKLNISRNTISSQGILCLHLPRLTLLNIDETYVRPEIIQNLKTNCPLLATISYWSLYIAPSDEEDFR